MMWDTVSYWIWVWVPVLILLVVLDLGGLQTVRSLDLDLPSEGKPTSSVSVQEKNSRESKFLGCSCRLIVKTYNCNVDSNRTSVLCHTQYFTNHKVNYVIYKSIQIFNSVVFLEAALTALSLLGSVPMSFVQLGLGCSEPWAVFVANVDSEFTLDKKPYSSSGEE